jgi:flagellar assembly factor FliW
LLEKGAGDLSGAFLHSGMAKSGSCATISHSLNGIWIVGLEPMDAAAPSTPQPVAPPSPVPVAHETAAHASAKTRIRLPFGLIGLRHLTCFELEPITESWPFQRLRALEGANVEMVVLEPNTFLESYPIRIRDEDAEDLGIADGESALVLNIVAFHQMSPLFVTVNLAGPIVVNRVTGVGKQVIVTHSERYSVAHVLMDARQGDSGVAPGSAEPGGTQGA